VLFYLMPSCLELSGCCLSWEELGYPTGSGVLRYVEDNPDLPMRAISTSTDPNVLGGLLILDHDPDRGAAIFRETDDFAGRLLALLSWSTLSVST
jgi:hypothetical protein